MCAGAQIPTAEEIRKNSALGDEECREGKLSLESGPQTLTLETTSVCNLRCVMCPHGLEAPPREFGHFDESLVDRLLPVMRLASLIQLHGLGEPLMNPAFWRILNLTHPNQHVVINTNGVLLNKRNADRILETSLSEVSFSLDAATPETYRKIRGADFGKVVGNLKYLVESRRRLNRDIPQVMMNMTLMRENIEEVVKFVELAHEIGVDCVQMGHLNHKDAAETWEVVRDGWTFVYQEQMLSRFPQLSNAMVRAAKERAAELGVNLSLDWAKPVIFEEGTPGAPGSAAEEGAGPAGSGAPAGTVPSRRPSASPKDCSSPWNWMFIQTTGDVLPCCFGSGEPIGNINERSPLEIWNGARARTLRRYIRSDRVHRVCAHGVCKFVNGRPSSDRLGSACARACALVKRTARGLVGEKTWAAVKPRYKKIRTVLARRTRGALP